VADDNKQNRDLAHLVLEEQGLLVSEVENGEQAVAAVQASPFDLILMDLHMPVMDGFVATQTLRAAGVKIPILALTAHAFHSVEEEIEAAGFSGHITKPIDIDHLLEVLAGLLGASAVEPSEPATALPDAQRSPAAGPPGHLAAEDAVSGPPVRSRLPVDDPRYREIVVEFVEQVDGLVGEMTAARDRGDFEQLAQLAHTLRGSGGTVGFDAFTAPTRALESAARDGAAADVDAALQQLRGVASRITVDGEASVPAAPETPAAQVAVNLAGPPLASRLPVHDPRYRAIVVEFVEGLDGQLAAMEQAGACGDFAQLAILAHELKGAGGGVGFDEFTEPSKLLESAARAGSQSQVHDALAALRGLAARVVMPEAMPQVGPQRRAAGG